jgi:hypothetical protein
VTRGILIPHKILMAAAVPAPSQMWSVAFRTIL